MHVLLVGGLGYIGRHVASELHRVSIKITTLDRRLPYNRKLFPGEAFVHADIMSMNNMASLVGEMETVDTVVHLAALIDAPQSMRMPETYYQVNFTGTLNVLQLAKLIGVKKFVFASSAAVYGSDSAAPLLENTPILRPENPYGGSKLFGERVIRDVCNGKIANISLRFFNVVGCDPEVGVVPTNQGLFSRVVNSHQGGDQVSVFGNQHPTYDGYAVRDYVNVMDVARAVAAAVLLGTGSKVYNVGSGVGTSVKSVIDIANTVFNGEKEALLLPARVGEVSYSVSDISRIKDELGWVPDYPNNISIALLNEYNARKKANNESFN